MTISSVLSLIVNAAARLAKLGSWPAHVGGAESLTSRVPQDGDTNAPGFDAGIACALGLIPVDKQRLSAVLHVAYTPEAVAQVRSEAVDMDPDSETTWWLAACWVCREGGIDWALFQEQIEAFGALASDPRARRDAALAEFAAMTHAFTLLNGVPYATRDGGLQGAYLAGFRWGVEWRAAHNIFCVGTYEPTLGLEEFPFSDRADEKGRPMSGPVHGSRQYVKACDFGELARAIEVVRAYLG